MPALEMAQDSGKLIAWLKREGEAVVKGEPIMEIETDKVTVEIESPGDGILSGVQAREGDVIPVGRTIGWILAPGEAVPGAAPAAMPVAPTPSILAAPPKRAAVVTASPVARKLAEEHGVDLSLVKPDGGRVEKADVLAYLSRTPPASPVPATPEEAEGQRRGVRPASPKARRLAAERGVDLASLAGSGPDGAVLAADVLAAAPSRVAPVAAPEAAEVESVGTVWRVMAERMTASWTSAPHFYLTREVAAGALAEMRARILPPVEQRTGIKPTYTDLLVKLVAAALRDHPRMNAAWSEAGIRLSREINIGIATAIEDGLIVPVIHGADGLSVGEIAAKRSDLVERANAGRLRPADIGGGTFTLTNLGMYHVDAFAAVINPPQAALLAVGRIADRVVPVDGQPAVRPTMIVTLSCDHRAVDGARAARFLDDLVKLIEEPWGLLA